MPLVCLFAWAKNSAVHGKAIIGGNQAFPDQVPGTGIVDLHSLIPDALFHAFATFGVLMAPDLPLARRQHEMIATVVSAANRCQY